VNFKPLRIYSEFEGLILIKGSEANDEERWRDEGEKHLYYILLVI
jgi:hypothetical protein